MKCPFCKKRDVKIEIDVFEGEAFSYPFCEVCHAEYEKTKDLPESIAMYSAVMSVAKERRAFIEQKLRWKNEFRNKQ